MKQHILLLLLSVLIASQSSAEYYSYEDLNGAMVFTDNPSAIPPKVRKKATKVDVDMSPAKKVVPVAGLPGTEIQLKTNPAMKLPRKVQRVSGVPPAAPPTVEMPPPNALQTIEAPLEQPDPALSTPLRTIRLFRRSLASGDYASAAKCLGVYSQREVQAILAQLPPELTSKLSNEFTPAVEIVRVDDEAVYSIGAPEEKGARIMKRHEVFLRKVGQNWKIVH